ncbi:polyketide cyclase/dehydrase/lipid transport protein [Streptomyces sp. TLI_235]|nr:SRPBCC family protein [Streptomyces sp. TLI_235]PBC66182.1 polyketide cyclase/dehydrase/lipid transport protein [Streptomyces sp. TLI_235]
MATTIRVAVETSVTADRVLDAAHDFSARRASVFPAVSLKHLRVHRLGDSSAEVTEGSRAGAVVWERCAYDWSRPGSVKAEVVDSNVYIPGSTWELTARPTAGGSHVEMTWVRNFLPSPGARLLGTAYRTVGPRMFRHDARRVLRALEKGA